MSLNIKTTKDIEEVADFVASSINKQLELGKNVLWFATGGSSIKVQSKVASKIKEDHKGKLVITLTDERFGAPGHSDSNWFQLKELGFDIAGVRMIPFLTGKSISETTK